MMNSHAERSHQSISSQANDPPPRNEHAGPTRGLIPLVLGGLLLSGARPADSQSNQAAAPADLRSPPPNEHTLVQGGASASAGATSAGSMLVASNDNTPSSNSSPG